MKPSKRLAGVVALATVAAGVSVVIGSSAANAAAPGTLTCNTGGNLAPYSSTWTDTNAFTLSPASVPEGGTVTATWTSAAGLVNGSPATLLTGSTQVQVVAALTGVTTGNLVLTTAPGTYPDPTNASFIANGGVLSGVPLGPISATATFSAPYAGGAINATVSFIDFNSNTVDTYCSASTTNTQFPASGAADVVSINTPNFQTPTGLPTPGNAGNFTTSNPNYGDLQVSAGAVSFGSATTTVSAPTLANGQVTGQVTGVTAYAAKGNTLNPTGTNWPTSVASGGFTAALCTTSLATCDANATNTLSTDASGNLSGTVTVPTSTAGARALKVTATVAGSSSSVNITILGTPTFTIVPVAGPVGTVTAGTAAGFQPSSAAVVFAAVNNAAGFYGLATGGPGSPLCTGAGAPVQNGGVGPQCIATGPYIPGTINTINAVTTSATGGWTGNVTVTDPLTTQVELATKQVCTAVGFVGATATPACTAANVNVNNTATVDYLSQGAAIAAKWSFDVQTCSTTEITGTSTCNTNQHVYASILAGSLTQAVSASANNPYTAASTTFNIQLCDPAVSAPITLANGKVAPCAVSVPTTDQTYAGQLNPIVVTDTRGATVGWNLTATAANLSDGTHTIANSRLSITPACATDAAAPGSATGATAGAPNQTFAGSVTLCSKDTTLNAGGTTGGVWDISTAANGVSLAVPAFQAAGNYTTNMLINLA
jgi:hypothetical protein